jgi:hypothetical protein
MLPSEPPTTMKPPTTTAPSSAETIQAHQWPCNQQWSDSRHSEESAAKQHSPNATSKGPPTCPILHSVTGIVIANVLLRPVVMDHDG